MCRQDSDMFSYENVLEIILAFDDNGLITYDNAAARENWGTTGGCEAYLSEMSFPGCSGRRKKAGRPPIPLAWRYAV